MVSWAYPPPHRTVLHAACVHGPCSTVLHGVCVRAPHSGRELARTSMGARSPCGCVRRGREATFARALTRGPDLCSRWNPARAVMASRTSCRLRRGCLCSPTGAAPPVLSVPLSQSRSLPLPQRAAPRIRPPPCHPAPSEALSPKTATHVPESMQSPTLKHCDACTRQHKSARKKGRVRAPALRGVPPPQGLQPSSRMPPEQGHESGFSRSLSRFPALSSLSQTH